MTFANLKKHLVSMGLAATFLFTLVLGGASPVQARDRDDRDHDRWEHRDRDRDRARWRWEHERRERFERGRFFTPRVTGFYDRFGRFHATGYFDAWGHFHRY